MAALLTWLDGAAEHPLIASSISHYELEFIHPFEDGNGRMGRLWQTLILTRWKALFSDVPVERLLHARQRDYREATRQSSADGEGTRFIASMHFLTSVSLATKARGMRRRAAWFLPAGTQRSAAKGKRFPLASPPLPRPLGI